MIIPGLGTLMGQRTLDRGDFDCISAPTACNGPISLLPTKPVSEGHGALGSGIMP